MRLNNTQLAQLRQKPQTSKLNLSIFQPVAIFKAQVNNASAGQGDRVITYDNVSLGVFGRIENGMTMWVGTAPGLQDLGKIRVRSATSTTITVSENNNIRWVDNAYLTVWNFFELWPVYPHIIQDPTNPENVIFYKDYDIAYSNQNSVLGTYVNAGPHRAVYLDPASGQAQVYYSSTGSYNLIGDTLNYNWFFEGATVTGSSSADPGYITYNAPGHYVTRLSISGSSGGIDTTYRYVSVYNQANPPIQKWQLSSLNGSRDEGGYTASFKVYEIIPIQEHAVVVLFGENWYGDTKVNIGGNFPNAGDTFFVGYIDKGSIQYDYEHSEVTFDAVSLTGIMKKSSGFSVSVGSVKTPTKWYELLDMDGKRALYHYLRWHTTALNISDFEFKGDDYKIQFFDSNRESMYDAINNYMQNTLIGKVVSDRQGKVWMEVDAQAYTNPTGTFTSVMDITRNDWMNTPNIDERLTPDISYLEYGGVAFSGVNTGTFNAYIGSAPGNAPGFYGTVDNHEGLALLGQQQLNQLVGNIYANGNSPFPTVGMDLSLNASNLDIAPQETVELHINRDDTVRNLAINGLYIPDSMPWRYDPQGYTLLPQPEFKQLVTGYVGETVTIPANPADFGGGGGGINFNFPPLPDIFPPVSNPTGDGAPSRVLIHDDVAGLLYTQTFDQPTVTWYQVNGGLTSARYQIINKVVVCPNGAVYVGRLQDSSFSFLARAQSVGSPFTVILDQTAVTGLGATLITDFNCNPDASEEVVLVLNVSTGLPDPKLFFFGTNGTFTAKATVAFGGNPGSVSYGGSGKWLITASGQYRVMNSDVSAVLNAGSITDSDSQTHFHFRAKTSLNVLILRSDNAIILGTNNCTNTVLINAADNGSRSMAVDPSGTLVLSYKSTPNGVRSTDGGYSFNQIANLPVLQLWAYDYFTGDVNSSKWVGVSNGGYVYYTDSFWNTNPTDKRGNLLQINPIAHLNIVKVIG